MIPNNDLAIQWDLAVENRLVDVALEEQGARAAAKVAAQVCAPLAEICEALPKSVHLGYHMCFGTLSGWPSRQPPSLARQRDSCQRGGRSIRPQGRVRPHPDARRRSRTPGSRR